jgi:hypothetical protein
MASRKKAVIACEYCGGPMVLVRMDEKSIHPGHEGVIKDMEHFRCEGCNFDLYTPEQVKAITKAGVKARIFPFERRKKKPRTKVAA